MANQIMDSRKKKAKEALDRNIAKGKTEIKKRAESICWAQLERDEQIRLQKYAFWCKHSGRIVMVVLSLSALGTITVLVPPAIVMTVISAGAGGYLGHRGGQTLAAFTGSSRTEKRAKGMKELQAQNEKLIDYQIQRIELGEKGDVLELILNAPLSETGEETDVAYEGPPSQQSAQSGTSETPVSRKVIPNFVKKWQEKLSGILPKKIAEVVKKRENVSVSFEGAPSGLTWGALLREMVGERRANEILLNDAGPENVIPELAEWREWQCHQGATTQQTQRVQKQRKEIS